MALSSHHDADDVHVAIAVLQLQLKQLSLRRAGPQHRPGGVARGALAGVVRVDLAVPGEHADLDVVPQPERLAPAHAHRERGLLLHVANLEDVRVQPQLLIGGKHAGRRRQRQLSPAGDSFELHAQADLGVAHGTQLAKRHAKLVQRRLAHGVLRVLEDLGHEVVGPRGVRLGFLLGLVVQMLPRVSTGQERVVIRGDSLVPLLDLAVRQHLQVGEAGVGGAEEEVLGEVAVQEAFHSKLLGLRVSHAEDEALQTRVLAVDHAVLLDDVGGLLLPPDAQHHVAQRPVVHVWRAAEGDHVQQVVTAVLGAKLAPHVRAVQQLLADHAGLLRSLNIAATVSDEPSDDVRAEHDVLSLLVSHARDGALDGDDSAGNAALHAHREVAQRLLGDSGASSRRRAALGSGRRALKSLLRVADGAEAAAWRVLDDGTLVRWPRRVLIHVQLRKRPGIAGVV
eukprot:scaffold585_cov237-Pinguiococcus_pyrenoidosus.AAC.6